MRLDSRPTLFLLAHLGLVALLAQVAQAQEAGTRPAPKPTSVLEKSVVEAINTGANLFNNEDFAGCYRLYQGALIAYAPVIDGLPDVKKKVEAYHRESLLARTEGDKAIILRKALDEILVASQKSATEAAIHATTTPSTKPSTTSPTKPEMPGRPLTRPGIPTEPAPKPAAVQSLWVRLGGIDSIKPIVSEFIRLSITDPKIDFSRNGKYPLDKVSKSNLELLMIQYFSQVAGGNETYTGRPMLDSHRGMKITDAQFNLMMIHLVDVLRAQKIPQAEASELVSLVNASRKEIVEVKTTESAPAPTATPTAPSNIKPLWDRLGGEKSVTLIVHNLVERSSNNPNVDFTRGGKYPLNATTLPKIERQIVEYISSKTGGPLKYTGRDLKKAHQGMGVTENQFDSMNGDLVLVMRKLNIAQEVIDELVGQIGTTFDEIVEKK